MSSTEIFGQATSENATTCILGLGYVGLTLATVLSDVGYRVTGVDRDRALIRGLRKIFRPASSTTSIASDSIAQDKGIMTRKNRKNIDIL